MTRLSLGFASFCVGIFVGLASCQSPRPVPVDVEPVETSTPEQIERELRVVRDPVVEKYLEGLMLRLREPTPALPRARVFRADAQAGRPAVVRGDALYVSLAALRACRFENEAAVLVALGLERGSEEPAIDRLYQGGFDPRAMVALLERQKADAAKVSRARARIAIYPPLRNPVVSTEAFSAMMRRLQQLR